MLTRVSYPRLQGLVLVKPGLLVCPPSARAAGAVSPARGRFLSPAGGQGALALFGAPPSARASASNARRRRLLDSAELPRSLHRQGPSVRPEALRAALRRHTEPTGKRSARPSAGESIQQGDRQ